VSGVSLGPFDALIDHFIGRPARLPCIWKENCSNQFISVDAKGSVAQCDCWVTSYPEYFFGNIFREPDLTRMLKTSQARRDFVERPKRLVEVGQNYGVQAHLVNDWSDVNPQWLEGIERVDVERLDLMDPASVDAFAARYTATGRPLHILINNAGIMESALARDARGYESQFATNHLGHFQLSNALLPALRAANGARVVELSSWGHHLSDIRWDDPHFETGDYDGMVAYGQSKTANVLFAVELDRRWSGDGIRGYSLHPGSIVGTNLAPSLTIDDQRAMGLVDEAGRPIIDPARGMKTPEQGASTTVWGATSPLLADIGGVYLMDNDVAPIDESTVEFDITSGELVTTGGVMPYAADPESAQRLWELSERLLKG